MSVTIAHPTWIEGNVYESYKDASLVEIVAVGPKWTAIEIRNTEYNGLREELQYDTPLEAVKKDVPTWYIAEAILKGHLRYSHRKAFRDDCLMKDEALRLQQNFGCKEK